MRAIIVWHYYRDGKLLDYSTTYFEGNIDELVDCVKADDEKPGKILHQVVML